MGFYSQPALLAAEPPKARTVTAAPLPFAYGLPPLYEGEHARVALWPWGKEAYTLKVCGQCFRLRGRVARFIAWCMK